VKLDIDQVKKDTTLRTQLSAGSQVKRVEQYLSDEKSVVRLEALECRSCFYLKSGATSGQAFSNYICSVCSKPDQWPNTHVPNICADCAKENRMCHRCGASLDYADIELAPHSDCTRTQYGFRWGNINISRMCNDPRAGRVLLIMSPKHHLQVRFTNSGLIRCFLSKSTEESIGPLDVVKSK